MPAQPQVSPPKGAALPAYVKFRDGNTRAVYFLAESPGIPQEIEFFQRPGMPLPQLPCELKGSASHQYVLRKVSRYGDVGGPLGPVWYLEQTPDSPPRRTPLVA